ncbi:MAG: EamA family transporter [Spirochaetales bacterium]|nr:EamA family transporter [Spirochaetales bacterium]
MVKPPPDIPGRNEQLKGFSAAVGTSVLWSTSGLFIKLIDWHPIAISGSRCLIAAILLIAVNRRFSVPKTPAGWGAAVSYCLAMTTFVIANKLTTSANAIFLQYLAPAFVAILSVFMLKETLRLFDWLILGGILGGMALFFLDRIGPGGTMGNVIAVASGLSLGVFTVCMRLDSLNSGSRPIDNIIFSDLITAVISIPFIITAPAPGARGMLGILFLGLIQKGVTSITYTYAVRRITAFSLSVVTLVEPLMNPVWVYLVIGERPSPLAVSGGLVILALVTFRTVLVLHRARFRR